MVLGLECAFTDVGGLSADSVRGVVACAVAVPGEARLWMAEGGGDAGWRAVVVGWGGRAGVRRHSTFHGTIPRIQGFPFAFFRSEEGAR